MLIDGIALAGYRSFGEELQKIGPLSKVSILIGANNSGKSNVLTFFARHFRAALLSARDQRKALALQPLDIHQGLRSGTILVGFPLHRDSQTYQAVLARLGSKADTRLIDLLNRLVFAPPLAEDGNTAWFLYQGSLSSQLSPLPSTFDKIVADQTNLEREWYSLWHRVTGKEGGAFKQHWIPETLQALSPVQIDPPHIEIVPAVRRIGEPGVSPAPDFSGLGIIDRLAQLQNPPHDQQSHKERFEQINEFLRDVTGTPSATIEIPYARDMILVHAEERTLPLHYLGTGIHEVVILAAAATVLTDALLCIEEPELHLHPTLQKKLLSYLNAQTTNQYLITTHSSSLLDCWGASVFRVRHDGVQTTITAAASASDVFGVAQDLGYRASDLLQTNCVIWVEGPSDRIYLNYWIRSLAPDLTEGLHYSVMFYGGRLLRHLSANDPDVDQFISLRRLNRNLAVLIDSDKTSKKVTLSPTKQRILNELDKAPGFAWVTAGREIENYIPRPILESAARSIHPAVDHIKSGTRYSDPLRCLTATGNLVASVDKVKIAREVASHPFDWNTLGLREELVHLLKLIYDANGLSFKVEGGNPPA